ncbi:GvpL/GvpF family gas vesicle protein [Halobacteria archaeon AArc-curdl1]|uniref:GvpL/GvpF family gas vesicle protein n=1 Tax=Natronosalvus hydrolyticus TaxID=2979988 RepID=A0AAP2ZA32_9EURY|nr:GvpL/GvpF family gas vesicle protein [Halobacteria archaeon AArc-curdl1]
MSHRYVYGVVDADDALEFETEAVAGAEKVYPITHRHFAALVSDIETTDPERTDEDAKRHDEVLREIMLSNGSRTVVPMRFGMVFENDRALKNVLRGADRAFRRSLREIDGTVELGLKIVAEESDEVDREAVCDAVADELEPLAVDAVDNGLFSDRLVLNRSYLVDRDERDAFDEAIGRIEDDYEELIIRYTGPFAPYSFVNVRVGAQ